MRHVVDPEIGSSMIGAIPSGSDAWEKKFGVPYVGLRPFERKDRRLFFGRDRDAHFLTNKVLTSPLTLLYAQSGVGKTSLLRALVIPQLAEDGAFVVYFDGWGAERPHEDLIAKLIELARDLGSSEPIDTPTLPDIVRLIAKVADRSVVLVLDQFEEFLVKHVTQLDPLRRELGSLIRATDTDMRVVIALREEFLAALEPFRPSILNLFASTYRLDPLERSGLQEAIERPASLFGASYEPELLERLTADLHFHKSEERGNPDPEKANSAIELPVLQIVCGELWRWMKSQDEKTLSLEAYLQLGGAPRIIRNYVERTMPQTWRDQVITSDIMQYLAPPSGLKQSYSAPELAIFTGHPPERIQQELERLEEARILRTREHKGERRFELQHDRFTAILGPWAEHVRRKDRTKARQRRMLVLGGVFFTALIGTTGVLDQYYELVERHEMAEKRAIAADLKTEKRVALAKKQQAQDDLENATDGCWDDPERTDPMCFDAMAQFFLWRMEGKDPLGELRTQLERRYDRLPPNYGLDLSGLEFVQLLDEDEEAKSPLVVHYSDKRGLHEGLFTRKWESIVKTLAETWGIPAPARVAFVREPAFPPNLLRIEDPVGGFAQASFEMNDDEVVIETASLAGQPRMFFERFSEQWRRYDEKAGTDQYIVPRWSLPVWKVAGLKASDGSGFSAVVLANQLLDAPQPLLSKDVVKYLLSMVAKGHPRTVAEARAARGDRIASDLAELVKRGQRLKSELPLVLDLLAEYPRDESSEEIAALVVPRLYLPGSKLPEHFHGPWAPRGRPPHRTTSHLELDAAYQRAEKWLGFSYGPIQVFCGNEDAYHELTGDFDATQARLDEARLRFFGKFGFEFPGVWFRWAKADDPVFGIRGARAEVLYQNVSNPHALTIEELDDDALVSQVIPVLSNEAERLRSRWLDPDTVHGIKSSFRRRLESWLDSRYSLTDLKLLLRAVVEPVEPELQRRSSTDPSEQVPIPPGHTLMHAQWLLRSLVFWEHVDGSPAGLVKWLRQTQVARETSNPGAPTPDVPDVAKGIRALGTDDLVLAGRYFKRAIDQDRDQAIAEFLAAYPEQLRESTQNTLEFVCSDPLDSMAPMPSRAQQVELLDLLRDTSEMSKEERRAWQLCYLATLPSFHKGLRLERLLELLRNDDDFDTWTDEQLQWVTHELITGADERLDRRFWASLRDLMLMTMKRLEVEAAINLFVELDDQCGQTSQAMCLELLEQVADANPMGSIPLTMAKRLSKLEDRAAAIRALEWVERSEPFLSSQGHTHRAGAWRANAALSRAQALFTLALLDDDDDALAKARALYEELVTLEHPDLDVIEAQLPLLRIYDMKGDLAQAGRSIARAQARWPKRWELLSSAAWLAIGQRDGTTAQRTAEGLIEQFAPLGRGSQHEGAVLMTAADIMLLTRHDDAPEIVHRFLQTGHDYRDYTAMVAVALLGSHDGGAQAFLDDRWSHSRRVSNPWTLRLRRGDVAAWRETLIGYFLGYVERETIFAPLRDEQALAASDLAGLGIPRRGLLCEAHFYDAMVAKANGDEESMRASLSKVLETRYHRYTEYRMARFLLGQSSLEASSSAPR